MISLDEYRTIVSELLDELPEEFFQKLSGGVVVSEAMVIPDYARGNDLYTMGHYEVLPGIRQITLFKGSFDQVYPHADPAEAKRLLRGILRHEFGGVHNSSSLEAEDEREKQRYISNHQN